LIENILPILGGFLLADDPGNFTMPGERDF